MITNKKSLDLLSSGGLAKTAAQTILAATTASALSKGSLYEPPEVYDANIKGFTNYDEKFKSKLSAHESLTHHGNFQHVSIILVLSNSNQIYIGSYRAIAKGSSGI